MSLAWLSITKNYCDEINDVMKIGPLSLIEQLLEIPMPGVGIGELLKEAFEKNQSTLKISK